MTFNTHTHSNPHTTFTILDYLECMYNEYHFSNWKFEFPFFEVTINLPTMSLNMERVGRNSDLGKAKDNKFVLIDTKKWAKFPKFLVGISLLTPAPLPPPHPLATFITLLLNGKIKPCKWGFGFGNKLC